jgi:hypothetical protein
MSGSTRQCPACLDYGHEGSHMNDTHRWEAPWPPESQSDGNS